VSRSARDQPQRAGPAQVVLSISTAVIPAKLLRLVSSTLHPLFSILFGCGPALNHENYETNPKQFMRILFKCNWFPPFGRFFCPQKEPKSPPNHRRPPSTLFGPAPPLVMVAKTKSSGILFP
jgi:hypothetical protein